MGNSTVNNWSQSGKLYIWRYTEKTKNYPGWHLTLDNSGADSLLNLLSLFDELGNDALRTLTVSSPTQEILRVPNNSAGWRAPEKLKISFKHSESLTKHWCIQTVDKRLQLELGRDKLRELLKGVTDIQALRGDYSIGGSGSSNYNDDCLWFWWHPKPSCRGVE